MFFQKNGESFRRTLNKAFAVSAALFFLTGFIGSASADYYDPCCPDPCCPDPCDWECPDFVFYADFLYWQVNVDGLEYAALEKGFGNNGPETTEYDFFAPDCEMEPGFRLGVIVDLGCCNWDFYAQYTWLNQCINDKQFFPENSSDPLIPLVFSQTFQDDFEGINLAKAEWDTNFNVFDFGFGRTFAVNCCFDFRPHLGFKATWQDLCYDVRYEDIESANTKTRVDIHNEIDFNGIGLRGGFDAAWRFSQCFSLVGGLAISTVWTEFDIHRQDTESSITNETQVVELETFKYNSERCALIPVTELLFGLQYNTTLCDCYEAFVFVGWENQVWWDLNRFIFVSDDELREGFDRGPNGNITYQGLTLRAGFGF